MNFIDYKKICHYCQCEKSFNSFVKSKSYKDGRAHCCLKCSNKRKVEYYKKDIQKNRNRIRNNSYKKLYNLSLKEYDQLKENQNNLCFLCGNPPQIDGPLMYQRLQVDHCHKTGKTRKLLCRSCNLLLGLVNDSPELLRKAANYIEIYS